MRPKPPELSCSFVQLDGCTRAFSITLRDAVGDVDVVTLDAGDGSPLIELDISATPGATLFTNVSYSHCFAGHSSLDGGAVFATDRLGSAGAAVCLRGVSP